MSNIDFYVNGRAVTVQAVDNVSLLNILRSRLELRATRYGCGTGHCGTCTVLVDGIAENKASEWRTFGRFSPKKIKEKMGRKPRTNEKIYVPEKISVKFKMAKELKNKINQNESYTN